MGKSIKNSRVVAFALVIMLVFVVAFSEYFIHREAAHECHDEECPICVVISQSNNLLSSILKNNSFKAIVLVLLCLAINLTTSSQNISKFSLVNNNIRLNE